MTDTEISSSVKSLGATVDRLRDAVDHAGNQQATLAEQVIESNNRAKRDRKVLRILTAVIVSGAVTLILLTFSIFRIDSTNDSIRDCTTPSGKCAQRGAKTTGVVISSIALRGERERIKTELPIAEVKGDTVRVETLKVRLDDLEHQISKVDSDIAAIQSRSTTTTVKP